MVLPLAGFTVGVTADRRWQEQAEMLRRRGAEVIHGPSIRTVPLGADQGVRAATLALVSRPPDLVIAHTGLGMRSWLALADGDGMGDRLVDALAGAEVLARGPKAAGAALSSGLEVVWRAPSETMAEVVDHVLARPSVRGLRIAFQRDGGRPDPGVARLRTAGADVVEVPVYRWHAPDDPGPAERLIEATLGGRVHALTFTSSPALCNFVAVARALGVDDALRAAVAAGVSAVCIGPVCAAAARGEGIDTPVVPRRARMGSMIACLTDTLAGQARTVHVGDVAVELRGSDVVVADTRVELTERESVVLRALAEQPGVVVSKAQLLARCWGDSSSDPHLVEVTIARVRRRIADHNLSVSTIHRRGYRLVATDPV
jgi:uroporphyrinogen-III synthase